MLTRKWNWTKTNESETGRSCRSGWQRLNGRCEGQTAFLYAGCSLCLSQCCIVVVANFNRPATEPSICNCGGGECKATFMSQLCPLPNEAMLCVYCACFLRGCHTRQYLRFDGDTTILRYDSTLCFKLYLTHWVYTICSGKADTIQWLLSKLCHLTVSRKDIATDAWFVPQKVRRGRCNVELSYVSTWVLISP